MSRKTAIIIGAGPAGLTAAFELLRNTDIIPDVFEMTGDIGGISKTVNHKGNRIDIGGHRFFSKSDRIMEWWTRIFPLQGSPARDDLLLKRKVPLSSAPGAPDPENTDNVMLVRSRISRIFFLRKFLEYPISLNARTISTLGITKLLRIGASYAKACTFPVRPERSLEDFFVNRFGRELYLTFFKDYTEKVWGVPCHMIKPEWGAQRVKGLSISKALVHALRASISRNSSLAQKNTETSLIGQFLYPKYGPGQLWEDVARLVQERGGRIHLHEKVTAVRSSGGRILEVETTNGKTGESIWRKGDYFLSSMPLRDFLLSLSPCPPPDVSTVANGLVYRDFITIGLLLNKLKIRNETCIPTLNGLVPDNWIYIQDKDVKLGRIQIFNNWSPYMVADPNAVWIGLEYFCNEGDNTWNLSDEDIMHMAIGEVVKIDMIDEGDIRDGVVIRMPKAYPAYFGSYDQFPILRRFLDSFENLFPIGRNGMHRYNNMDHSMLAAMEAVGNIRNNIPSKENIWAINAESEYHEENSSGP